MSRRARSIELWTALKTMGKRGVEALIDQLCERAQLFARLLAQKNFNVLNEVVFNQVLLACDTPQQTERTLALVQASGECWWRWDDVERRTRHPGQCLFVDHDRRGCKTFGGGVCRSKKQRTLDHAKKTYSDSDRSVSP